LDLFDLIQQVACDCHCFSRSWNGWL